MSPSIDITCTAPSVTDTGVLGGVDMDVTITAGGSKHIGGVTLIRDHDGGWGSWGSLDHWLSGSLLDVVRENELQGDVLAAARQEIADDPDIDEAVDQAEEAAREADEADHMQADWGSPYGDPLEAPAY